MRKFLDLLESDGIIKRKKSKNGTTLKVSNYNDFQAVSDDKKTINYTIEKPQSIPQRNHKVDTNNNENNVNNDNNSVRLGEFKNVILKKSEYEKLINTHTKPIVDKYVDRLSDYMESEGKTYKSHYATIKRWIKADEDKINNKQQEQQPNNPKDEYGYDITKIRKQLLGIDDEFN